MIIFRRQNNSCIFQKKVVILQRLFKRKTPTLLGHSEQLKLYDYVKKYMSGTDVSLYNRQTQWRGQS